MMLCNSGAVSSPRATVLEAEGEVTITPTTGP